MSNEGRVYFALYGEDFDPDDVTRLVGIEPTSIRRKADPRPKHSCWEFSSECIEDELVDIYAMSSSLVSCLRPCTDKIAEARKRWGLSAVLEVVLRITVDGTQSTPAIGFDADVIAFLHAVGATIDIDTYRKYD